MKPSPAQYFSIVAIQDRVGEILAEIEARATLTKLHDLVIEGLYVVCPRHVGRRC